MSDEDEDKDSNTAKNDGATERSSYFASFRPGSEISYILLPVRIL